MCYRFVPKTRIELTQRLVRIACASLLSAVAVKAIFADTPQSGTPAPQALKQLSLDQLGNLEVTSASKEPEEVWKTPAAIFVLTQEDIRRSGATTIPELLRLVPGIEVARADSDHWSIGIRGFGSQFSKSVLVLIDGRSVYTPLFAGVYWQVQNTVLEDVERIEVIRGPGGTIWGANAVNGVINIITKKASDTHGTLASLGGGNIDQGTGEVRYGSGNGKNLDYRFYGMGFTRGPEFHPDGANFDEWRSGQLGFRSDWNLSSRDTLTFQGDTYKGRDGERVAVSLFSPPSVEILDGPHFTSGDNLLARWERKLSDASDIQLQGYYDRTSRFSPQLNEIRDTFDIDFLYRFPLKSGQDFLLGAGARWSPDSITQKFPTLDFEPHRETDTIYSWFLQDQIPILPNHLSFLIGSKFEHNNFSGFETQPNARLLWTVSPHQTVWLAITRAVRTPSRLDQDFQLTDFLTAVPPIFLRVVGNKAFVSERLVGSEAGYRTLLLKNLYVDVAAFHNNYDDLFGFGPGVELVEPLPAPAHIVLQVPISNALRGQTDGIEIAPDWKPSDWLQVKGSYSYLYLHVHDKPGFTDTLNAVPDNGSSPHHQIQFQFLFNLPKNFELDPSFRYVSALPAQAVPSYETVDVRFGWHPSPHWEFSIDGQNLLQPRHPEFGGDADTIVGIERSVYAKITWRK